MTHLFRDEVIKAQTKRLNGAITLDQPLPLKVTVALITTFVLVTLIFLLNAEYKRKEMVIGFLRSDKGEIKSFSQRRGTIKDIFVEAGVKVKKGDPLLTIENHKTLENGQDVNQHLKEEVERQINLTKRELINLSKLKSQELKKLKNQINLIESSILATERQKNLTKEKLMMVSKQSQLLSKLNSKGYISTLELQKHQEQRLTIMEEVTLLDRTRLALTKDLSQLQSQLNTVPQHYLSKIILNEEKLSILNSKLTEQINDISQVIKATHEGIVTDIHVFPGETLNNVRPLLTILPHDSKLIAELLLPTRAAGFIEEGDNAHLLFDAFPHQKFGFIDGHITRIDNTVITQNDVNFPIQINEPVYRLQASLNNQFFQFQEKEYPLKSGMIFKADIELDTRTLFEWLIEPLLGVKGI